MSWSFRASVALDEFRFDATVAGSTRPMAIVGPNGSGKTTLLRLIAGAMTPDAGEIVVESLPLFSSERGINLPPQERSVGYVPQGYGLFPHLSVVENVAFGVQARGRTIALRDARAMLHDLEAGGLADRRPGSLSGGEQQRVALARALVTSPRILLLDEPLAALDVQARRDTRSLLASIIHRTEQATVVVTHDVRDVVALQADVCVMEEGRIVQRGDVAALAAGPVNAFVEEFVGLK